MKIPVSQGRSMMRSIVRHRTDTYTIERETDIINDRGARTSGDVATFDTDLWLYAPTRNRVHEEYGVVIDGDMAAVGIPDDTDLQHGDIIVVDDETQYHVEETWTAANERDQVLTFANLQLVSRQ